MSERGRDPQPWDDDLLDERAVQRKLLSMRVTRWKTLQTRPRDWNEEPFDWNLLIFNRTDDLSVDEWLARIARRTSWLSFAWACVYVLAAGVVRAVGRAARHS